MAGLCFHKLRLRTQATCLNRSSLGGRVTAMARQAALSAIECGPSLIETGRSWINLRTRQATSDHSGTLVRGATPCQCSRAVRSTTLQRKRGSVTEHLTSIFVGFREVLIHSLRLVPESGQKAKMSARMSRPLLHGPVDNDVNGLHWPLPNIARCCKTSTCAKTLANAHGLHVREKNHWILEGEK